MQGAVEGAWAKEIRRESRGAVWPRWMWHGGGEAGCVKPVDDKHRFGAYSYAITVMLWSLYSI